MNFRQKLAYIALGGGLMLVGMLFSSMSPLTAQGGGLGDITCTSLAVVDKDGNKVVKLRVNEHGGAVSVWGKAEQGLGLGFASLFVNEGGGHVTVYDKDEKIMAQLGVTEDGGRLIALDKDGNTGAFLGISERGWGLVSVYDKDGKGAAQLSATEHGGSVNVYGKVEKKTRVRLGVNEYGHGVVSTWDKHGYRYRQ